MANSPGYPWKWWRLTPVIGLLNWPNSMLAWDVIMLNGYLVLNLAIPFYILYSHFVGREPSKKKYVPFIYVSVVWAVSIHLVTAFLFAGLPARPFWNSAAAGAPLPRVRLHRRTCVHDPVARVHPVARASTPSPRWPFRSWPRPRRWLRRSTS